MEGKQVEIAKLGEGGVPVFVIGAMVGANLYRIDPKQLLLRDPRTEQPIRDSVTNDFSPEDASDLCDAAFEPGSTVWYGVADGRNDDGQAAEFAGCIVVMENGSLVAVYCNRGARERAFKETQEFLRDAGKEVYANMIASVSGDHHTTTTTRPVTSSGRPW